MNHNDAMEILHFWEIEKTARADFKLAWQQLDAPHMADAARRWELAENMIPPQLID